MPQYRYERLRGEYAALWAAMRVVKTNEAIAQAKRIIAGKARYRAVEAATGVPWFVVGALHLRESGGSFATWLHNGDPMRRADQCVRTVHVPAGRPPDPAVSWEEGARDALVVCEHLDEVEAWCPERVAYAAEQYNGFGYRNPRRNIPSPYLWGGTSVQRAGKFVRDGEYEAGELDPQIGVMAVLKVLLQIDPEARFEEAAQEPESPEPAPSPESAPPPISPKARDTETRINPLRVSRTIWGGLASFASSISTAMAALFQRLHDPYTLAAFLALLAFAGFALWLVVSGRINAQGVIAHLAEDDTHA